MDEPIKVFPDEEDCEAYFICRHGSLFRKTCAPGFKFDRDNLNCNVPDKVDC